MAEEAICQFVSGKLFSFLVHMPLFALFPFFLNVPSILCVFVIVRRMAGMKALHLPMPLSCLVGGGGTWVQVEWRNLPVRKTAL